MGLGIANASSCERDMRRGISSTHRARTAHLTDGADHLSKSQTFRRHWFEACRTPPMVRIEMDRSKRVIYWISTLLLSFFIFTGGVAYVLRIQGNVDGFVILGYPIYFMVLIGVWKILGSIVIVVPGLPRLRSGRTPDFSLT
jgi:hypothetical protein